MNELSTTEYSIMLKKLVGMCVREWNDDKSEETLIDNILSMLKRPSSIDQEDKILALQSSNKELNEKLRVAKEFLENIRFKCLGDAGGKCYCDELEAVLASLSV